MKQYPKYKDSGIQWIGQIPEGWNVLKFKHCFNTSTGMNIAKSDLTESGVAVISYGQIHAKTNTRTHLSDDLVRYIPRELIKGGDTCKLCKNDIVFADTSEDLEGCGNAVFIDTNQEIYAGYHTIIAHPIIEGEIKYLAYLFNTPVWRQQLRKSVVGIKVYSITQKLLKDSCLLLPPFSEQESIVRYLDEKTAKIDETVNILGQQKAELIEYRKAIIDEFIWKKSTNTTKQRFKYIVNLIVVKSISNRKVALENIESNTGRYISTESEFSGNGTAFNKGDIIYGKLRPYLRKVWLAEFDGNAIGDVFVYRVTNRILGKYAFYLMLSNTFTAIVNGSTYGAKMPRVSSEYIGDIQIPLPPLSEQQKVVEYLDSKTAKIDEAMKRIDEQIEDLRAYRTALITEAVTGKIDVR